MDQFKHAVRCIGCGLAFVITSKALNEHPDPNRWKCEPCRGAPESSARRGDLSKAIAKAFGFDAFSPEPSHLTPGFPQTIDWRPVPGQLGAVGIDWQRGGGGGAVYATADDLNKMQEAAATELQRLRGELEQEKATSKHRAGSILRLSTALDEQTRFLAGLNLQDHPIAEQKERDLIVGRAMAQLRPAGMKVDEAAVRNRMDAALKRLTGPYATRYSTWPDGGLKGKP